MLKFKNLKNTNKKHINLSINIAYLVLIVTLGSPAGKLKLCAVNHANFS